MGALERVPVATGAAVPSSATTAPDPDILPVFLVLVLGGAVLFPVFYLIERRLDDGSDGRPLASVPGTDHDPETGRVTLSDGTDLDRREATAVEAVYDYFARRPTATRDEVKRECYGDHPAGYEDPDDWWAGLVDPALSAIVDDREGDDGDDD